MNSFAIQTVPVHFLYRNGHLIAYGLSEEDLYSVAPSLRHDTAKEIVIKAEKVGIVRGQIFDWSEQGGHSFNPKLHWDCPGCGQHWFTDFNAATPNPAFEPSGCDCVSYWFVSWDA